MFRHCQNRQDRVAGFTLLELSAVIVVAGLLVAAFAQGYRVYLQQQRAQETLERLRKVANAISTFTTSDPAGIRYPCPADPRLPPSDPNAGVEVANCNALPNNACTGGGLMGVCRNQSRAVGTTNTHVVIGAVPWKTLLDTLSTAGVSLESSAALGESIDSWGNQFVYAVTGELTDATTYDEVYGAVGVSTENGDSLTDPARSAHYIVVSLGPNGKGAYTMEGVQNTACTAGTMDEENCDGDEDFISGLISEAAGATYFDDLVQFSGTPIRRLWKADQDTSTTPATPILYNTNAGNVGIGYDPSTDPLVPAAQPTELFEVNDPTGNWSTAIRTGENGRIYSDNYCWYSNDTSCASAEQIAEHGIYCHGSGAGTVELMTGFRRYAGCQVVVMSPVQPNQTCPTGEYIIAIRSNGLIECAVP